MADTVVLELLKGIYGLSPHLCPFSSLSLFLVSFLQFQLPQE
jgi:hypothetical protein